MNNTRNTGIAFLLVGALLLSACAGAAPAAPESAEPAAVEEEAVSPAAAEEVTYVDGIPVYGCLGSAEEALVDLECREVTMAVENAYLPFNYISSETGQAGGWDYDVMVEICTRLHCTPVFQETAWDTLIQSVSAGQFDMSPNGISITDERWEIVDFSMSYIVIEQRLLARAGEDRFTNIEEFVNNPDLVIGTQTATTNLETAMDYLPDERISAFDQFPFAVQALIGGDVDAVLIDEVAGLGYISQNAGQIEFVGPSIASDPLGLVFPKGSELVDPFDLALQSMMDDGLMDEINERYFGTEFTLTYDDIE
jgi:polar amino acid transport system substrate-binding protein